MNKNTLSTLILTIMLSTGFLACNSYGAAGRDDLNVIQEKSFKTEPGKMLKLSGSVGDILVTAWDKSEVYVKILGNEKAKDKIEFKFDEKDGNIQIDTKRESWFAGLSNIQLRFEIKVPSKYNSSLNTAGGDIRLAGIEGKNELKTSGGDISIKEVKGEIIAATSGGDIDVNKAAAKLDLSTSGGNIDVMDFSGELIASTSGGDIHLTGQNGKVFAETSGGDITLNYSGENKGIELESSGGNISVSLPDGFNASAYLNTSGGDVAVNFPTNDVKKLTSSKFEGDLNAGGNKLTVKTSGGSISINKR